MLEQETRNCAMSKGYRSICLLSLVAGSLVLAGATSGAAAAQSCPSMRKINVGVSVAPPNVVHTSPYLAKARGLGLSQQLMRAFDGMAADSRSADVPTPPTTSNTTTTSASNTAYTGRTGWNGMRLDAPAPGNSGAQWAGFNVDRALAGGDDNSIKDGFYRWTYGLSFNPAGKSKEEIGQFLRDNVSSAREYGLNILDVRGDQILVH